MIKSKAYARITEIGEKHDVDVKDQLMKLAMEDSVPESVIRFIEEYDKKDGINPRKRLNPELRETLREKKLYKTLCESDNDVEQAKAVSSFLTHILIEFDIHPDLISEIREIVDFDLILDNLLYYFTDGDIHSVYEASNYIQDLLND